MHVYLWTFRLDPASSSKPLSAHRTSCRPPSSSSSNRSPAAGAPPRCLHTWSTPTRIKGNRDCILATRPYRGELQLCKTHTWGSKVARNKARTPTIYTTMSLYIYYPGQKKNYPRDSRREERCSILRYHARWRTSNAGQSHPRLSATFALRWSRLIEHDITRGTAFFSLRISRMVFFFFFVQGCTWVWTHKTMLVNHWQMSVLSENQYSCKVEEKEVGEWAWELKLWQK